MEPTKEKMVRDKEKGLQLCRPSVKLIASFNNYPKWKDKLRENCFKRVREGRTRLLWKLRLSEAKVSNHEDLIKSTLKDIVSDELRKIKEAPPAGSPDSLLGTTTDDMIWEYDGLPTAYQGDCEEMLLEMQRIFYEDFGAEESRKGPDNFIITWEDEEDEYLARLVYDNMLLNGDHEVCRCTLELTKGQEVDLNRLRLRLGEAHAEHLDRGGCRLRPEFCIETKFGLTALYIKCQGCHTFEIVL
ncbi:hypothetical protein OROHE_016809 [Orobanche hederae]